MIIQRLLGQFKAVKIKRHPQTMHRHDDTYTTISQKIAFDGESIIVQITKRTAPSTILEMLPTDDSDDWRGKIRK